MRPQMAQAYRLLRAASRLGVPGSLPAPPELLPAGARVLGAGVFEQVFAADCCANGCCPTGCANRSIRIAIGLRRAA